MTEWRVPKVVLFSTSGALAGVDPLIRGVGARLVRIASVEPRPVDPALWLGTLPQAPTVDTVVVTSQAAVSAGVIPWLRASGPFPKRIEVWAVGPRTARAVREAGIRRVCRPCAANGRGIARALRRPVPRKIVYLRSDRAGPQLARILRRDRHRVTDVIVYRLRHPAPPTARSRRELSAADLLVVTSPSGFGELHRRLDPPAFARLARTTPLVVLGPRSERSARQHGFRHVSVAPPTDAHRFLRHLVRELRTARA